METDCNPIVFKPVVFKQMQDPRQMIPSSVPAKISMPLRRSLRNVKKATKQPPEYSKSINTNKTVQMQDYRQLVPIIDDDGKRELTPEEYAERYEKMKML